MTAYTARTDFAAALNQIASERGIDVSIVIESIKAAILAAYKKDGLLTGDFKENWTYEAEIDAITGETRVYGFESPITGDEELPSPEILEKARKNRSEVTPPGFGRIAAQTAKQVILQKIREAEKDAIISNYENRVGTLVNGMILRFVGAEIIIDLGKGEAVMPPHEQSASENYRLNQRLTFYIESIRDSAKGREIIVSRAHKGLVEGLFKREVPEVGNGTVQIKSMAREPGVRTKIAVFSSQSGVDPVGSCVGQKGVRVQAVIEELNNEKIDIIQYSDDPQKFVLSALLPAQNTSLKIDEGKKSAVVKVPEDQLSLAIGKDGQNVRLASKLTGYKIDIVGDEKAPEPKEKGTSELKEETQASDKPVGDAPPPSQTDDKKQEELSDPAAEPGPDSPEKPNPSSDQTPATES